MRIIAGDLGGRIIEQPKSSAVRPVSQKVRAALFNSLGDIAGQSVLDLYAGSGAVGLEALSRGAAHATLIEKNKSVYSVVMRNIEKLGLAEQARVVNQPVEKWLVTHKQPPFDLVIADPPYADIDAIVLDQVSQVLSPGGILVLSHTSKISPPELKSLELVQTKVYGDTALSFYKK